MGFVGVLCMEWAGSFKFTRLEEGNLKKYVKATNFHFSLRSCNACFLHIQGQLRINKMSGQHNFKLTNSLARRSIISISGRLFSAIILSDREGKKMIGNIAHVLGHFSFDGSL